MQNNTQNTQLLQFIIASIIKNSCIHHTGQEQGIARTPTGRELLLHGRRKEGKNKVSQGKVQTLPKLHVIIRAISTESGNHEKPTDHVFYFYNKVNKIFVEQKD